MKICPVAYYSVSMTTHAYMTIKDKVSLALPTFYQPLCREKGLGTIISIACSSAQFWVAVNQSIYGCPINRAGYKRVGVQLRVEPQIESRWLLLKYCSCFSFIGLQQAKKIADAGDFGICDGPGFAAFML